MASKRIKQKNHERKFYQVSVHAKKEIIEALYIENGGNLIAAEKEASKINDYVFSLISGHTDAKSGHTDAKFIYYIGLNGISNRDYVRRPDLRHRSVKKYKTRLKNWLWLWLSEIMVEYGIKDGLDDYDNVIGLTDEWKKVGMTGIQVGKRKADMTKEERREFREFVDYMQNMYRNYTESEVK